VTACSSAPAVPDCAAALISTITKASDPQIKLLVLT
jgi:hypothetical protein